MGKPVIQITGLSKKYRIFHQGGYLTLRDSLAKCFKNPFGFLKNKGNRFSAKEDFLALRDISFNVNEGEVVGLIGRNGAGKTTLLKILSRITYPSAGEVRLRGRVGSLLEVGTGFHAELTGRENIYFNGSILGMKKKEIDKKLDEIVAFSGVEKFIDTPVKHFSSGMQVRLAFSVAAHLDTEIILVDEVLAVGDAEFQKKCIGKMKNISGSGRTVLFVSHNMAAVRNLCSRAVILESGKLFLEESVDKAVAVYLKQNLVTDSRVGAGELESRLEGKINRANPSIKILEVGTQNESGMFSKTFNSEEPIMVYIKYQCLQPVNGLRLSVYITDEENHPILVTANVDENKENDLYKREQGVYTSICRISPDIFGEKHFFVSVHLEYPKVEHLILDRILGFDTVFSGYNSLSAEFKNAFIRPKLKWATNFIGQSTKENAHE